MSQPRIEKLTSEQEALIPAYLEKWRAIAFSTEPIDRQKAKETIKTTYAAIGLQEPEILVFDGPNAIWDAIVSCKRNQLWSQLENPLNRLLESLVGNLLTNQGEEGEPFYLDYDPLMLKRLNNQLERQLDSQLEKQLDTQLESQLDAQLRSQLRMHLESPLDNQLESLLLDDQLDSLLESPLDSQLERQLNQLESLLENSGLDDQLDSLLESLLEGQLNDQLRSQLRSQMESLLGNQLESLLESLLDRQLRMEVGFPLNSLKSKFYCLLFDFCISVLNCTLDQRTWELYQSIVNDCGWIFASEKTCFVCERPIKLSFDNQQRLHAAGEPAIQFVDGFSVYADHGVRLMKSNASRVGRKSGNTNY